MKRSPLDKNKDNLSITKFNNGDKLKHVKYV